PRPMAPPSELSLEIVRQVSPVMDHVGLIDREHGIARLVRFLRQVAVTDQGYQFWGARDDRAQNLPAGVRADRLFSPLRPPKVVVLNIEKKPFKGPIQHAPDRDFIGRPHMPIQWPPISQQSRENQTELLL